MRLFYSQAACSLAPHIALHEAGLPFELEPVNLKTKHYRGGDFKAVNPKGYVPTLELDDKQVLTEVQVILQYIADRVPEKALIPKAGTMDRYRELEWLNFVATELHKGFSPLWKPDTPDDIKAKVKANLALRFDFLSETLKKNNFLMGAALTVADCYLFTVLNWSPMVGVELSQYPALMSFMERMRSRPSVQAALKAEGLLK